MSSLENRKELLSYTNFLGFVFFQCKPSLGNRYLLLALKGGHLPLSDSQRVASLWATALPEWSQALDSDGRGHDLPPEVQTLEPDSISRATFYLFQA